MRKGADFHPPCFKINRKTALQYPKNISETIQYMTEVIPRLLKSLFVTMYKQFFQLFRTSVVNKGKLIK